MWRLSQDIGRSPSQLLGINPSSLASFYFDRAIWRIGSQMDSEMEAAANKAKNAKAAAAAQARVLAKWLGDAKGLYRDPAGR